MKIIETRPREKGFVLRGHCQNLLDDPRSSTVVTSARVLVLPWGFVKNPGDSGTSTTMLRRV